MSQKTDVPGNQNIIAMHAEKNQGACNDEPEQKLFICCLAGEYEA
jgi:hypothetical protein